MAVLSETSRVGFAKCIHPFIRNGVFEFMILPIIIGILLSLISCRLLDGRPNHDPSLAKDESAENDQRIVGRSDKPCYQPQVHYLQSEPRILAMYFGSTWASIDDKTGKLISSWPASNPGEIQTAAISFNRSLHMASTRNNSVVITDIMNGREKYAISLNQADSRPFFPMEMTLSADDRLLMVVGILDNIDSLPDPRALAKNNDIKENADATRTHSLRMIFVDLERQASVGFFDFQDQYIRKASFSQDNRLLNIVSYSGLTVFNVNDPSKIEMLIRLQITEFMGYYEERFPFIFSADVSHDFRLAILSLGTSLVLVDLETRKIVPSFNWALFPPHFMFAIRWLGWSSDDRYIYASDLGSNVYKFDARTGEAIEHSRIDYISQDWVRGQYLNYHENHPKPGFGISPRGDSFVTLAPQDPERPNDCPGLQIHRMHLK